MNEELKRRLVGAAVLTALGVILIPILFDDFSDKEIQLQEIPMPPLDKDFSSSLISDEVISLEPVKEIDKTTAETKSTIKNTSKKANKSDNNQKTGNAQKPKLGITAWSIKVGSFSKKENAENVIYKLRKNGFQTPEAELVNIKGKDLYRVIVGPMLSEKKARSLLQSVNKISGTKGKVMRFK